MGGVFTLFTSIMAITEGSKYVVIPIKKNWSDFKLKHDDKCIVIYGADGETMVQKYGDFGGQEPEFEEMYLCSIERHRSDENMYSILGEAVNEDGNRFLILVIDEE